MLQTGDESCMHKKTRNQSIMKEKSNKSTYFTEKKFSSRLVSRVFLISSICLIVPLIIYSLAISRINYNQRADGIFKALSNVTLEKIHLFLQVLDLQFATMETAGAILRDNRLTLIEKRELLLDFSNRDFIHSVYYIIPSAKDKYTLAATSQEGVPHLDMTQFIKQYQLDQLKKRFFIGKNLENKSVLFLAQSIYDHTGNNVVGFLVLDIQFEKLISSIFDLSEWKKMSVSLLDKDDVVVASSFGEYNGFEVSVDQGQTYNIPNSIVLIPEKKYDNSYVYYQKDIPYLAVIKPIPPTNFKLMTAVPKDVLYSPIQMLAYEILILLLCILVIGGGILYFFLRQLGQPINQIYQCMRKVSQGDLSYKYQKMRFGFEINSIGTVFNETIDKLVQVMNEVKMAKVNEEVLARELTLGQEVQRSLLPRFLSQAGSLKASAKFVSAKQVGGDCYDFYQQVERNRTLFYISDTAGKGIMACLYALDLRSLLRAYADAYENMEEILINTNRTFCVDTSESGVFVTAWYGVFNEETKELTFASIGHPPTLLVHREGDVEMLSTEGIAFGAVNFDTIEIKKVSLQKGDFLVLYTDGVIEAQNAAGEYYTLNRLAEFLRQNRLEDPHELCSLIHDNVLEFSQGEEQFDDLTLLVIKVE